MIKIVCPGAYQNLPHKVSIKYVKYRDICKETQQYATIAYNNYQSWFEVDSDGKMVEFPVKPISGEKSYIPWDYEILSSFLRNYKIEPTWIDCEGSWGSYDEDTGHWTGAVGKV